METLSRGQLLLAGGLVLALVGAGCGGGTNDNGANGNGESAGQDVSCSPEVLEEAVAEGDGPVDVTLWHGYTEVTDETIDELVDEFNAAQDEVRVRVVNQAGEGNILTKMVAGRTTGDLPDAVIVNEIELQRMIDTELTVPVGPCIEANEFDLSDFIPQAIDYYTVEDVQMAMPFNVASPVLIYNQSIFNDVGLDPERPPETLDELHDMAREVNEAGYEAGLGFERYGWLFEQFVALGGDTFVNNGNGRDERATEVTFGGEAGQEVFDTLAAMIADGSVVTTPQGDVEHLLGLGNEDWAMTITSSSALGPIFEVLLEGQYEAGEILAAPMPGRTEEGGTVVGGGAVHIVSPVEDRNPVVEAAVWQFIEHLSTVETSAYFAARTGYVPVRISAVDEDVLQERWDEAPYFRVPYDQLLEGEANEATAGAVQGEMEAIRDVVEEAWRRMAVDGLPADEALDRVVEEADGLIAEYNERVVE